MPDGAAGEAKAAKDAVFAFVKNSRKGTFFLLLEYSRRGPNPLKSDVGSTPFYDG